ncbi:hypothetical protein VCRA2121O391_410007 [Vibrio crassostreae]|nr:hypothetical protein VCRA2113O356_410026 [Vibrio crassostreae]CAK2122710.1 hypothetical protein VCRA2117O378_440026 [Vibrio crassostreae]CAK2366098.1 hypothetical protein VCRA2119O386_420007 [Vibrio crassostreae]CAK2598215.1 hypothetical protein VCRA2126O86_120036 [Vibrio crassostreae]CAK2599667.1 hypothetical protein VCRA2127O91_120036 [Vibrio crassostreae]
MIWSNLNVDTVLTPYTTTYKINGLGGFLNVVIVNQYVTDCIFSRWFTCLAS